VAHPAGFGVPDPIEHGIKGQTGGIPGHEIIADEPWEVNDDKNGQRNQRRPTARAKEENNANQACDEDKDR
jgi:hypothetical protein